MGDVYFTDIGGASTLNEVVNDPHGQKNLRLVKMTTIDDELKGIGKEPSFMKIDVEGFDFEAIKGADRTFKSGCLKLVKFENNSRKDFGEIALYFADMGWKVFALNDKGSPVDEQKWIFNNANLFACPRIYFKIGLGIFKINHFSIADRNVSALSSIF